MRCFIGIFMNFFCINFFLNFVDWFFKMLNGKIVLLVYMNIFQILYLIIKYDKYVFQEININEFMFLDDILLKLRVLSLFCLYDNFCV